MRYKIRIVILIFYFVKKNILVQIFFPVKIPVVVCFCKETFNYFFRVDYAFITKVVIRYYIKFFIDISDQFVQVSVDTLIDKKSLVISDDFVEKIRKEMVYYIKSFGPIETSKYIGYSVLPSIDLKWNKYLLVGIIRTFLNDELEIEYTDKTYNKTDFIIKIR